MAGMKHVMIWLLVGCSGAALAASEGLLFAEGLARRGMSAQAATEYEAYLANEKPEAAAEADARQALAGCYEKLGRSADAQAQYRRVMELTTGDRRLAAQLALARLLLQEGQAEAARPLLETAATGRTTPELSAASKFLLGQCYEALGRGQDASTLYRILSEGESAYALHAQVALAELAAKSGQAAEAIARYKQVLQNETRAEERAKLAIRGLTVAYAAQDYGATVAFAREAGEKALGENRLLLPAVAAALRDGKPEDARAWLAADETRSPKATAERLMLAGAVATAFGDTQGAITAYERVIGEFPNSREARPAAERMLGLRAQSGQPETFLKAYTRVAILLSDEAVAQLTPLRLEAALKAKDNATARGCATWLVEHAEPAVAAEASYRLGWLAQEEKDWALAGEAWMQTAERWPTAEIAPKAAYAAAYAFQQAPLPDRAEAALRLAIASGNAEVVPLALMLQARLALADRDTAGASAALDEYLTRFPQGAAMAEAAYLRGLIFFNQQDFAAAEQALGKALAVREGAGGPTPLDHARTVDASLRRAQALHTLGRGEEAAALLQPLLGLKDAQALSPPYLRWLAEFQLERQAWSEAEAAARTMAAHPAAQEVDRVLAQVLLGRAAEGAGQPATALAAYEQALKAATQPTIYDAQAAYGAGRLNLARGEAAKARDAFRLATDRAKASDPATLALRGRAYAGLAKAEAQLGAKDAALRAYMNLIIFYDDPALVPEAFRGAIALLEAEGRTREAETLREECRQRYGEAALKP